MSRERRREMVDRRHPTSSTVFDKFEESQAAMDAVLSMSWQPSAIDAVWLDGFLNRIQLAIRDAWWRGYLHLGYGSGGPVKRLIESASELPLTDIEPDITSRSDRHLKTEEND